MSSTTVYLKIPQVKEVYETEVYLGMIADVHSSDRAAEAKAKAVKVTSFSGEGKEAAYVGNVMDLVEKIEKTGQNIQVDNLGETDFVVTYREAKPPLGVDEDGTCLCGGFFRGSICDHDLQQ